MNTTTNRTVTPARLVPVLFSAAAWVCAWGLAKGWFYPLALGLVVIALRWRTPLLLRLRYGVRPAQQHERDAVWAALVPARSLRGRRQPRVWIAPAPRLDGVLALTTLDVALPEPMLVALLRGQLDSEELCAATVWTIGTRHAQGDSRAHDALEAFCLPVTLLAAGTRPLRRLATWPLVRTCWDGRGVLGVIALMLPLPSDHVWAGVGAAGVIALSYLHPWWQRRWYAHIVRAGDDAVTAQGLGATWARVLRRRSPTVGTEARAARLERTGPPEPRIR